MFTSVYPRIERERIGEGVCARDVFRIYTKPGWNSPPRDLQSHQHVYFNRQLFDWLVMTEILYGVHINEFYETRRESGGGGSMSRRWSL